MLTTVCSDLEMEELNKLALLSVPQREDHDSLAGIFPFSLAVSIPPTGDWSAEELALPVPVGLPPSLLACCLPLRFGMAMDSDIVAGGERRRGAAWCIWRGSRY